MYVCSCFVFSVLCLSSASSVHLVDAAFESDGTDRHHTFVALLASPSYHDCRP